MAKNATSRIDEIKVEAELANSKQDNTSRSRIAHGFTFAFIFIVSIIVIGGPIYNVTLGKDAPIDVSGLLSDFVSQFGTPLGFVLGYYFKDKMSN